MKTFFSVIRLSAKMEQQQWQTAQEIINNLPANTPEEQDFITIQQINLQRLSAAQNFELDIEQANQLYAIANAYGYQAPAAQALLGLLNGNYYEWAIPQNNSKSAPSLRYPAAQLTGNPYIGTLAIIPNPAAQTAQVTIPPLYRLQQTELHLYNLHGKLMLRQAIPAFAYTATLNVQTLPSGIYFAVLNAQGMPTAQVKLMIQH
ncbi:T9SS C-terminal target domain-containing protein [Sphingobacteriales bacterium UPWRP_1]|nr:hypothetical protein BVG80_01640 [Sphingobacteriales bacterium TSM_CSM]PSJ72950.1 T9SS C-terminal target domain-containing protein [Sphingobacteriales bacterium UPWRP_1]